VTPIRHSGLFLELSANVDRWIASFSAARAAVLALPGIRCAATRIEDVGLREREGIISKKLSRYKRAGRG
jgi:hypothetical protein